MATRFVPNEQGIRQLFSRSGAVGAYIAELAGRVERRAKANINSKTGELRDSSEVSFAASAAGVTAKVAFTAPYAVYYHEGTGPHSIGSPVFMDDIPGWRYIGLSPAGRGKIHPGTQGNPFLLNALDEEVRKG